MADAVAALPVRSFSVVTPNSSLLPQFGGRRTLSFTVTLWLSRSAPIPRSGRLKPPVPRLLDAYSLKRYVAYTV